MQIITKQTNWNIYLVTSTLDVAVDKPHADKQENFLRINASVTQEDIKIITL